MDQFGRFSTTQIEVMLKCEEFCRVIRFGSTHIFRIKAQEVLFIEWDPIFNSSFKIGYDGTNIIQIIIDDPSARESIVLSQLIKRQVVGI